MILLDTSIWIGVFRANDPIDLDRHMDFNEVVTCLPIIQEVLQGFRNESAFRKAHVAIFSLPIVENPLAAEVFEQAVQLYRDARRSGISIRSSVDCLIAACALRNDLEVIHRDRDFDVLAKISALRERRIDS